MALCKKITFKNKNGNGHNAGDLIILDETGAFLYNDTIIGKTIYLEFGDAENFENEEGEIIPCRHLTFDTTSADSFYVARYPFKDSEENGETMFPSITFGTLDNAKSLFLDKIEGGDGSPHEIKIGAMGFFSMGFTSTIGTDDMRNGKVNNTVFNIEHKAIYLKILSEVGGHVLYLGYKKNT